MMFNKLKQKQKQQQFDQACDQVFKDERTKTEINLLIDPLVDLLFDKGNDVPLSNLFNTLTSLASLNVDGDHTVSVCGSVLHLSYDNGRLISIKLGA